MQHMQQNALTVLARNTFLVDIKLPLHFVCFSATQPAQCPGEQHQNEIQQQWPNPRGYDEAARFSTSMQTL